jgi:AcrR family transcriptional regulator
MVVAPIPLRPRRSQRERRDSTRQALLDGALEALVALGWARTTTTEVCRRAGVSQGALFKHFPTKPALLAAAVAHLFERLVDEYGRVFEQVAAGGDRIEAAVRLLWELFQRPHLQMALELYTAARTDRELAAALAPVVARHAENLAARARALFEAAPGAPAPFDAALEVVVDALQGAALSSLARPPALAPAPFLAAVTAYARTCFVPRAPAGAGRPLEAP